MAVMKDGPDGVLVTKLREDEVITEELRDKIVHALSNSLLTQVHILSTTLIEKFWQVFAVFD